MISAKLQSFLDRLIAELEEDIMPIDGLIAFAESDMGAKVFSEEGAKNRLLEQYRYKYSRRRAFHEELRRYGMKKIVKK